jgi:arylsulfatase A-like enzyme
LSVDLAVAPLPRDVRVPTAVNLRSGLALLSIVALLCLSFEIELLQQIDSLRLYLIGREIALELAVVLLFSIAIACCWWFFVLLIGKSAGVLLPQRWRMPLLWDLWMAVPLAYLLVQLFEAFTIEVFPHWHQDLNLLIDVAVGVTCICIAGFFLIDWYTLQEFCRTRLAPIAWLHIVVAIVAAAALWLHGVRLFHDYERPFESTAASNSPDIYLITIDALRADDMSVYGYGRATTPNLDRFAQRSFIFDYFFANSNFTTPTTASMETGKLPWSHRIFQNGFLRDRNQQETLPALLKRRGYYTAMISSNFLAAPFHHRTLESYDAVEYASPKGLTGFRYRASNLLGVNTQTTLAFSLLRGLNSHISVSLDKVILGDHYLSPAEDVFERATQFVERHNSSHPIFLWSHILPPHDPYWPPAPYRHRFVSPRVQHYANFVVPNTKTPHRGVTVEQLRDAYDEMILYADHSVGEFLDWLDRTGRLDRSIVIVSADHGELFGHDRLGHGEAALYNGVIRIPLLIHLPGQKNAARIEEPAQQADLLPTLLDLVGAPLPNWSDGISLRPSFEAKSLPDRYVFSMNLEPNSTFASITKGTIAVMDDKFKFVRYLDSGKEQLFSYRTDEGEEHNLVDSEPDVAQRMRKVLLDKIEEVNRQFSGER